MTHRACSKGKFEKADLELIREAIHLAGLDRDILTIDSSWNFVNINDLVEIQPVLFDCQGTVNAPTWTVRRLNDPHTEPCSCGVMMRGAEIGTYTTLPEAVAVAVAEVVRLKMLAALERCEHPAAAQEHPHFKLNRFSNDFIRRSLHC